MNLKRLIKIKDASDLFAEKVDDINKSISYKGEILEEGEYYTKRYHGSVWIGSDEYAVESVDAVERGGLHSGYVRIVKRSSGAKKEFASLQFSERRVIDKKNVGAFADTSDVKKYEYPYDYISFPNLRGAISSAKQILIYELEKSEGAAS